MSSTESTANSLPRPLPRYAWGGEYIWPIDFTPAKTFELGPGGPGFPTPETPALHPVTYEACRAFGRLSNNQLLIVTAGSCYQMGNGPDSAVGGCAFIFNASETGHKCFRLEDHGPSGDRYDHTANRAELRAVIGALQYRDWSAEGYNEVVIATDSKFVAEGATVWVESWVIGGWKTAGGEEVENQDLWILLFQEMQRLRENVPSLCVLFWNLLSEMSWIGHWVATQAVNEGKVGSFSPLYEAKPPMYNFTVALSKLRANVSALSQRAIQGTSLPEHPDFIDRSSDKCP